jgi:eukaryotic-like serine/threonine-protein kinase
MDILGRLTSALIGRYDIEREIGRGGMATVYLARDVRHARQVAIKVLDPTLAESLGAERFHSEIRVTASLRHPNLLPLFDSGEADGLLFYVMPFVRGETIRGRLSRERELPVEEAIAITTAIAGALDHAHHAGVLHRDLKPENILLQDGQPVLADFGISLAVTDSGARATQTGAALGTPQYMSPEQAAGDRQLDARSDVYSLAAVLYEMLSGEAPHTGNGIGMVLAKVMTETPRPLRARRATVPAHVEWAVAKALEKSAADRFASAGDFARALNSNAQYEAALRSGSVSTTGGVFVPGVSRRRRVAMTALPWAVALGTVLVAAMRSPSVIDAGITAPINFVVALPPSAPATEGAQSLPDGSGIVYHSGERANGRLYVKMFDRDSVALIPGSEGSAEFAVSPDGRRIAFIGQGSLRVIPLGGGVPQSIVGGAAFGVTWLDDESVILGSGGGGPQSGNNGLRIVRLSDGVVRVLTKTDSTSADNRVHRNPVVIANGKYVLFRTTRSGVTGSARMGLVSVANGATRYPFARGANPVGYLAGKLLYTSVTSQLLSAPLDLETGVVGPPSVLEQRAFITNLSASGTLIRRISGPHAQLLFVDTAGTVTVVDTVPGATGAWTMSVSPDGNRLLFPANRDTTLGTWMYEIGRARLSRVTMDKQNLSANWLPDGQHYLVRSGSDTVHVRNADQPSESRDVFMPQQSITDITPDGAFAIVTVGSMTKFASLTNGAMTDPPGGPLKGWNAVMSTDGRLLAYESNESGTSEVYVRPLRTDGNRIQVSNGKGIEPQWLRDGRLVFYDGKQLVVSRISGLPSLTAEAPKPFVNFVPHGGLGAAGAGYALRGDGAGIYTLRLVRDTARLGVELNWSRRFTAATAR